MGIDQDQECRRSFILTDATTCLILAKFLNQSGLSLNFVMDKIVIEFPTHCRELSGWTHIKCSEIQGIITICVWNLTYQDLLNSSGLPNSGANPRVEGGAKMPHRHGWELWSCRRWEKWWQGSGGNQHAHHNASGKTDSNLWNISLNPYSPSPFKI